MQSSGSSKITITEDLSPKCERIQGKFLDLQKAAAPKGDTSSKSKPALLLEHSARTSIEDVLSSRQQVADMLRGSAEHYRDCPPDDDAVGFMNCRKQHLKHSTIPCHLQKPSFHEMRKVLNQLLYAVSRISGGTASSSGDAFTYAQHDLGLREYTSDNLKMLYTCAGLDSIFSVTGREADLTPFALPPNASSGDRLIKEAGGTTFLLPPKFHPMLAMLQKHLAMNSEAHENTHATANTTFSLPEFMEQNVAADAQDMFVLKHKATAVELERLIMQQASGVEGYVRAPDATVVPNLEHGDGTSRIAEPHAAFSGPECKKVNEHQAIGLIPISRNGMMLQFWTRPTLEAEAAKMVHVSVGTLVLLKPGALVAGNFTYDEGQDSSFAGQQHVSNLHLTLLITSAEGPKDARAGLKKEGQHLQGKGMGFLSQKTGPLEYPTIRCVLSSNREKLHDPPAVTPSSTPCPSLCPRQHHEVASLLDEPDAHDHLTERHNLLRSLSVHNVLPKPEELTRETLWETNTARPWGAWALIEAVIEHLSGETPGSSNDLLEKAERHVTAYRFFLHLVALARDFEYMKLLASPPVVAVWEKHRHSPYYSHECQVLFGIDNELFVLRHRLHDQLTPAAALQRAQFTTTLAYSAIQKMSDYSYLTTQTMEILFSFQHFGIRSHLLWPVEDEGNSLHIPQYIAVRDDVPTAPSNNSLPSPPPLLVAADCHPSLPLVP